MFTINQIESNPVSPKLADNGLVMGVREKIFDTLSNYGTDASDSFDFSRLRLGDGLHVAKATSNEFGGAGTEVFNP